MANATTQPNENVLHHVHDAIDPMPGTTVQGRRAVGSNIRAILGQSVSLARTMNNGQMQLYEGPAQSTYGIPFAIDGTATVVEDKIAIWIAGFRDPIKAIFDTSVHRSQKVIFKRKWVKGGQALVVPERAPARTISVAFDQREERLTRHAVALEQNIYLYSRPDDAREDLEMKLEGIRLQLEQALVNIGYAKAFDQGVDIVKALARGRVRSGANDMQRAIETDRMYVEMFAGVISKSEFPFKNLAAAIAKAGIYTPTGKSRESPAVMLVPPGMVDLPKFTSKSEMSFNVTGLTTNDPRNKVSLPLPNVMEYPDANIRVLVHTPPPSYREGGAAYPQVENNEMANVMSFATYYIELLPGQKYAKSEDGEGEQPIHITDFDQRELKELPQCVTTFNHEKGDKDYVWWLRPQMSTVNNSALLCTRPGAETGELLYAYPSAHVSTSQHTGSLILTLDVYYGCAIRHPERLMVLNGIQFNGIVGGHGCKYTDGTDKDRAYDEDKHDLLGFVTEAAPWDTENLWKDPKFINQCRQFGLYGLEDGATDFKEVIRNNDTPFIFYRGAKWQKHPIHGMQQTATNNGHLGVLDHPRNVGVIQGYQVYTEVVKPGEIC